MAIDTVRIKSPAIDETLAREIEFVEHDQLTNTTEWNINGEKAALAVAKD